MSDSNRAGTIKLTPGEVKTLSPYFLAAVWIANKSVEACGIEYSIDDGPEKKAIVQAFSGLLIPINRKVFKVVSKGPVVLDLTTHWTVDVPNNYHAERAEKVQYLVVHAMGEWVLDGICRHCTDHLQHLKLSVHAFCLPDGRIISAVDPKRAAFHAGKYNQTSIGMEMIVEGRHTYSSFLQRINDTANPPYTTAQYAASGWWFRQQADLNRLTFSDIRTHAELDPTKQDPGKAFDFEAFHKAFEAV